jgi:mono/diheme cytochrome c family protein
MSRGLGAASLLASLLYTTCALAQAPDALPPGEGRDIVAVACSQCHPITILRSLREGDQGWRQHINKMVLRGAQLTAAETDIVVDYLSTVFGPGISLPPAAKIDLPPGAAKELVDTRCSVCHDLTRVSSAKRSRNEWKGTVARMVFYGAPITPDEQESITSYIHSNFGR